MAGYIIGSDAVSDYPFHMDLPNIASRIRAATENARVLTLQLDGDELDAALWGLENYRKGE